jgi:hypothetical protein
VQLTPGNVPSEDARTAAAGVLHRTHQGFSFEGRWLVPRQADLEALRASGLDGVVAP